MPASRLAASSQKKYSCPYNLFANIANIGEKNGYFKAIYINICFLFTFSSCHSHRFCLFLVCLFLCALFVVRWKHCCSTHSQCSSLNVHTNAVPKSRPTNRLPISLWSAITLLLYILMAWWPPICFWVHYIRYDSVIAQLHSTVTFYLW